MLAQTGGRRVGRSQVIELPPVEPVVIEAWQYAVTCGQCGVQTVGAYPEGLEPHRTFGPRIEAHLGYFHERHHVSYERLVELCRDVFGLRISEGGIENALRRLVEQARPAYVAIRETVRGSPVINADETSARGAGTTQWQWVVQTPEASYHVIAPSRGCEVIDAFRDGVEPEVWGTDLYALHMLTPARGTPDLHESSGARPTLRGRGRPAQRAHVGHRSGTSSAGRRSGRSRPERSARRRSPDGGR
jgi:transposase